MLMKRITIAIAAAAAMLIPANIASAQEWLGPVASICAPETERYCAHERHGAGGVRACLEFELAQAFR